ncbi:MAG: hypothetical protein JO015_06085 [Verrucomicrobia bacterium]|nr:hypothetical protein [Verrucomicrobiota bacterium]
MPSASAHPLKAGDALRAAQDRLLDRLWQMPFYLVAARPPSSSGPGGMVNPATTQALTRSGYGPWRENIVATVFWVGEAAGPHNPVPNDASAWDRQWLKTFGGIDNPRDRTGVFPARFLPKRNPFYVALPFNDLLELPKRPPLAHLIPWAAQGPPHPGSGSLCHGAWVAVRNDAGTVCYAQWEDVGPFEVNHWQYVFGGDRPRPNRNGGAGIDLSPAVRDYLHLHGLDVVDWRFVRKEDVPPGPWLYYGRDGDKLDARLVVNALRRLVAGNE